jgi:hypothetical protein
MKNLYILLIALFAFTISQAQIVNIPDANFKNALLNYTSPIIDLNGDGEIQVSEAENVIYLSVTSQNISSLQGIESFINIVQLSCNFNQLTSLDVTQNLSLESLRCQNNQLTSLDVTQNVSLEGLECDNNLLTSLDVTQNVSLKWLKCNNNLLTSLDVTQNLSLEILWCRFNQLTSLDVTQNLSLEALICENNQLSNLDVINNIDLLTLACGTNQLTSIDVTQNTSLGFLNFRENQISNIDISQNLELGKLSFSKNEIESIDLSNNLALFELYTYENPLTNLDLSQHTELNILWVYGSPLENLNIQNGNNVELSSMIAYDNPNLQCIKVDDETATYPVCFTSNNTGWCIDPWTEYSEDCLLGVKDNNLISFSIYPNPAQDILNIESQIPIETLKIYNLQGQLVNEVLSYNVDVSILSAGLYFIEIASEGQTLTKKFIKE